MTELYAAWLAAPHKTATLQAVTEHFRDQLPSGTVLGKPCRKHGHTWNGTPWCVRKDGHCVQCVAIRGRALLHQRRADPTYQERKRQWDRARRLVRQQQDPDYRTYHREKSKRRKAQLRGNHVLRVRPVEVRERFAQFDHACAYCGARGDLHQEHFLPISKGGTHVLSNLLPACQACNYSKRDYDPEAWYRAQPFFTKQRWRRILSAMGTRRAPVGQLPLL